MLRVNFSKQASQFLINLNISNKKIAEQIKYKIDSLRENPLSVDHKKIVGFKDYYRIHVGKYRICYRFDAETLYILIIETRDKIYQTIK